MYTTQKVKGAVVLASKSGSLRIQLIFYMILIILSIFAEMILWVIKVTDWIPDGNRWMTLEWREMQNSQPRLTWPIDSPVQSNLSQCHSPLLQSSIAAQMVGPVRPSHSAVRSHRGEGSETLKQAKARLDAWRPCRAMTGDCDGRLRHGPVMALGMSPTCKKAPAANSMDLRSMWMGSFGSRHPDLVTGETLPPVDSGRAVQ
jgi:hypothetical protein